MKNIFLGLLIFAVTGISLQGLAMDPRAAERVAAYVVGALPSELCETLKRDALNRGLGGTPAATEQALVDSLAERLRVRGLAGPILPALRGPVAPPAPMVVPYRKGGFAMAQLFLHTNFPSKAEPSTLKVFYPVNPWFSIKNVVYGGVTGIFGLALYEKWKSNR